MTTLLDALQHTADECIDCGKCMSSCLFLAETGSPSKISLAALSSPDEMDDVAIKAYECSVCGLCSAVCPVKADPSEIFSRLRFHAQERNIFSLKKYSPLLNYESTGRRFPFKGNITPEGCSTVFFPGCTFPALFPEAVRNTYAALKRQDPSTGLILNCCSKPSKMLGSKSAHETALTGLVKEIESKGITKVLTCCSNCHVTFKELAPAFEVVSVYEELDRIKPAMMTPYLQEVTIHDPCVTRFEESIHIAVRNLLESAGVKITEMKHHGKETICCGEGGAVGFHNKSYSREWSDKRTAEAKNTDLPMATYCAGCVNFLSPGHPTVHILDLLMVQRNGIPKLPKFPKNYLNRILLNISAR